MSIIDFVKQSSAPAAVSANHIKMLAMTDGGFYLKDETGGSTNLVSSAAAIKSISAGTTRVTNGEIVLSNANGISFGIQGNTVTAAMPTVSFYENDPSGPSFANSARTDSGAANVSIQRFSVGQQISATRLEYLGHLTVAGSTAFSSTMRVMLYTMTGQSASSLASASATMTASSGGVTNSSAGYSGQSGTRWRSMSIGTWNLTPGDYLIAFCHSLNGPAGTTGSMSIYGKSNVPVLPDIGGVAHTGYWKDGVFSAATSAPPLSLQLTQVDQTNAAAMGQPYFRLIGTF